MHKFISCSGGCVSRKTAEAVKACSPWRAATAKPMSVALATVFAASFVIRHSSFTSHSAHSRNIISGTPERERCWQDQRHRTRRDWESRG